MVGLYATYFLLNNFAGQTSEKALFTTSYERYYSACRSSLENFFVKAMVAISAGRALFLNFENDAKILYSEYTGWGVPIKMESMNNFNSGLLITLIHSF